MSIYVDGYKRRKDYIAVDCTQGACAHCHVEGDGFVAVEIAGVSITLCKNCLGKLGMAIKAFIRGPHF